jgi:uncharacterized membrane protein
MNESASVSVPPVVPPRAEPPRPGATLPTGSAPPRLESVDALRGLIMVLMALDHARDFFHWGALHGEDPLNLAQTSPALFLTRWATHYCAPIFSFLAGTGVFLATQRGKTKSEISWFLVTRGAWLIFLELTLLVWFGWNFAIDLKFYILATLWALGWSMIVLAGLVRLPLWAIATFSLTLILGHNALDGITPESWGAWAWLWRLLHVSGQFKTSGGFNFWAFYPLIPWVGVMALGYAFGAVYRWEPARRRRWLLAAGTAAVVGFIVLRFTNLYGNLTPREPQPRPGFTLLSFINTTKYPPSLCYLLMTLGPGLIALALLERPLPRWLQPFLVFGRVPFFYYVLHIPILHALGVLALAAGLSARGGFGLPVVYAAWLGVVMALYFPCRWYAALKRRRRDAWLSYL